MNLIHRVTQRLEQPGSAAPAGPDPTQVRRPAEFPPATDFVVPQQQPGPSGRRSHELRLDFEALSAAGLLAPVSRSSRLAEEFRLIKRRLLDGLAAESSNGRANRRSRSNVILVASARPGEGKTFTALNLALSLVLDEHRPVLLIDADIALASAGRTLGVTNALGLAECLRDPSIPLSDVLLRDPEWNLTLLPAGTVIDTATDLFSGARMREFISEVAQRYADRIVLIDSSPLLSRTEAAALASQVGQVLLVVEAQKTSQAAVKAALDLLASCENVNLVLNKVLREAVSEQFGSYYVESQAPARAPLN